MLLLFENPNDLLGCLESRHTRHLEIHQDKLVSEVESLTEPYGFDSILSREDLVAPRFEVKVVLQHEFEAIKTSILIVDHENTVSLMLLHLHHSRVVLDKAIWLVGQLHMFGG